MMDDRKRVRERLANDLAEQAKLFRSELDFYAEHFTMGEKRKLRTLILNMRSLAAVVDK